MRIYFIIIQIFQMRRQNGVYIENFTHACNRNKCAQMSRAVENIRAQKSDRRVLKKCARNYMRAISNTSCAQKSDAIAIMFRYIKHSDNRIRNDI